MADRMDILATRKDEASGKTYYTRIGVAFPIKDGTGWSLRFDALPVSGQAVMFPPKADSGNAARGGRGGRSDDSDIPF